MIYFIYTNCLCWSDIYVYLVEYGTYNSVNILLKYADLISIFIWLNMVLTIVCYILLKSLS